MSSGQAHFQTSLAAGLAGAGWLLATDSWQVATGFALGCTIFGTLFGPDLDQPIVTFGEKKALKWLPGVGHLYYLFWLPYSWLIPYHRHWSSHLPVVGTILRLVYALVGIATAGLVPLVAWYATTDKRKKPVRRRKTNHLTRFLYIPIVLAWFIGYVILMLNLNFEQVPNLVTNLAARPEVLATIAGWLISDALHFIQDQIYSLGRRVNLW